MIKKAIVVDLDGTVALRDPSVGRSPYEYSLVHTDLPNHEVISVLWALWRDGHRLVFVSAREDVCFNSTYKWLTVNCPPFVKLLMRKQGDNRPDDVVKREIYDKRIKFDYDVVGVFDDRNSVVEMWRDLGLTCFQVADGDF